MKAFTKENIAKVPNKAGIYYFFDKNQRRIYIGHSKVLKHRLQSYYEMDDFEAHPTKHELRKRIAFFGFKLMPTSKAKPLEKKGKQGCKFNFK